MIWCEKYKPNCFSEIDGHKDIAKMLSCYDAKSMPHLLIHGRSGFGKRTLINCLINHLYGKMPKMKLKKIEVTTPSKTIETEFYESEEVIEITPSDYGNQDKVIIQSVIKQLSQTKPILSLFNAKTKSNPKLIIITSAEDLSRDAQAALRRTVEKCSTNFRLILLCTQISTIIEPVRSRFLALRISGYEYNQTISICKSILEKEDMELPEELLGKIVLYSNGDLKKAITLTEINCFNGEHERIKRIKKPESNFIKVEWEKRISAIVRKMKTEQTSSSLKCIRDDFYGLMSECISPRTILSHITMELIENTHFNLHRHILEAASLYDERLRTGNKGIIHLEGFASYILMTLSGEPILDLGLMY